MGGSIKIETKRKINILIGVGKVVEYINREKVSRKGNVAS